jgi:glycerol kinase
MSKYIAALTRHDQHSFYAFDHGGMSRVHQKEHQQIYPQPGWVEHDPLEIWERTQEVIRGALEKGDISATEIGALGITNQRETTVVWNKNTGKPIYNAIVWQDTRTDVIIGELAIEGGQDRLRSKTGSCDHSPGPSLNDSKTSMARRQAETELLFGNIDQIIWNSPAAHNGRKLMPRC